MRAALGQCSECCAFQVAQDLATIGHVCVVVLSHATRPSHGALAHHPRDGPAPRRRASAQERLLVVTEVGFRTRRDPLMAHLRIIRAMDRHQDDAQVHKNACW